MNTPFDNATRARTDTRLCLRRGEVVSDDAAQGSITCLQGMLWITQTGLGCDVLLGAGQTFQPRPTGLLVIEALDRASLRRRPNRPGQNHRPLTIPAQRPCNTTKESDNP